MPKSEREREREGVRRWGDFRWERRVQQRITNCTWTNAFHFLTLVKNLPVLFGQTQHELAFWCDHNLKSTTCSAQQLWRDRSVTRSPIDSVNNEIAEKPAQHMKDNKIKERNAIFYIEWVARNENFMNENERLTYIATECHIPDPLYGILLKLSSSNTLGLNWAN